MTLRETLQGWHDFYVTAGAASATLVGLLFVGLSLHIRIVVSHPDVRALARVTLTDFFGILLVSLALLQPTDSSVQTGSWLLGIAAVSLILTVRPALEGLGHSGTRTLGMATLAARFGVTALAFVALGLVGVLFVAGAYPEAVGSLLPVLVVSLVVAVRNTWDLLVTVAARADA